MMKVRKESGRKMRKYVKGDADGFRNLRFSGGWRSTCQETIETYQFTSTD